MDYGANSAIKKAEWALEYRRLVIDAYLTRLSAVFPPAAGFRSNPSRRVRFRAARHARSIRG